MYVGKLHVYEYVHECEYICWCDYTCVSICSRFFLSVCLFFCVSMYMCMTLQQYEVQGISLQIYPCVTCLVRICMHACMCRYAQIYIYAFDACIHEHNVILLEDIPNVLHTIHTYTGTCAHKNTYRHTYMCACMHVKMIPHKYIDIHKHIRHCHGHG
jgi:hypothetical protein